MTRRAGKRWLWALALLLLFLAAAWFTECSPARFWARRGHLTDLISAMFPPDWGYTSRILTPLLATVQMSVTGTALGAFLALLEGISLRRSLLPCTVRQLSGGRKTEAPVLVIALGV